MKFEKPTLKDVAQMFALVAPEVQKGIILMRSQEEIANTIRSYVVARKDDEIVGFCALYIYTPLLAEVRSLIVRSDWRGKGIGQELIKKILKEGEELGIRDFLVLTYQETFFRKMGFNVIEKSQIPNHKIWTDCIKCKHFPKCDEVALLKQI